LITGTQVWAGSEQEALTCLKDEPFVRSVVCLRRTLPDWWPILRQELHGKIAFYHLPVPDIDHHHMGEAILAVAIELLPKIETPVLIFCLHGRNRTGVLAGLLSFQVTKDLVSAAEEYRLRASIGYREEEEILLQRLCCRI
jgi:hypothetical protein